jgi:hypothetical protein
MTSAAKSRRWQQKLYRSAEVLSTQNQTFSATCEDER